MEHRVLPENENSQLEDEHFWPDYPLPFCLSEEEELSTFIKMDSNTNLDILSMINGNGEMISLNIANNFISTIPLPSSTKRDIIDIKCASYNNNEVLVGYEDGSIHIVNASKRKITNILHHPFSTSKSEQTSSEHIEMKESGVYDDLEIGLHICCHDTLPLMISYSSQVAVLWDLKRGCSIQSLSNLPSHIISVGFSTSNMSSNENNPSLSNNSINGTCETHSDIMITVLKSGVIYRHNLPTSHFTKNLKNTKLQTPPILVPSCYLPISPSTLHYSNDEDILVLISEKGFLLVWDFKTVSNHSAQGNIQPLSFELPITITHMRSFIPLPLLSPPLLSSSSNFMENDVTNCDGHNTWILMGNDGRILWLNYSSPSFNKPPSNKSQSYCSIVWEEDIASNLAIDPLQICPLANGEWISILCSDGSLYFFPSYPHVVWKDSEFDLHHEDNDNINGEQDFYLRMSSIHRLNQQEHGISGNEEDDDDVNLSGYLREDKIKSQQSQKHQMKRKDQSKPFKSTSSTIEDTHPSPSFHTIATTSTPSLSRPRLLHFLRKQKRYFILPRFCKVFVDLLYL